MIAIIAEKPSVAREIAAIAGATNKKEGYLQGNNYMVTWALGHLVGLAMPEEYGVTGFVKEHLPIIPDAFRLVPRQVKSDKGYKSDPGALKQLKTIGFVFDKCDSIIVATDAGREGELIFRYIYSWLGCTKPFLRLWISSLTEKAIKDGLNNLRPGADYDNLYHAAKSRSEADWLVGINASQALSIAAGQGIFSLGRVQTPTLAMVCSRYLENKDFVPVPFWELRLDTSYGNHAFSAFTKDRIESRSIAKELFEKQKQQEIVIVQSVEKKEVKQEPPLLYDLTALQKEANSKYGFSADKTLSIAQKLYESKYITYPRTGSRYISDDVFNEIPRLIAKLSGYTIFDSYVRTMADMILNIRPVDAKKVTDHHALLITGYIPKDIGYDERKVYDMVAGRMLEAFSGSCVKDQTAILLNCSGVLYAVKGSVTKIAGWRDVFNEKEEGKEQDKELPILTEGQELHISGIQLLEKLTKAKPLHTESSLLAAMEIPSQRGQNQTGLDMPSAAGIRRRQTCAKELEDEEQRMALKSCGIGTPATRAAIIETLFSRDYMYREKKSLVPTEKGLAVYNAVKDKRIADVEMTGMWEDTFVKIEAGNADAGNFKKGIEVYAAQITGELLNTELSLPKHQSMNCPKCGKEVIFYPKVVKCSDEACGFMVFTSLAAKKLSDDIIQTLLSEKQTPLVKGFKSKVGKFFDAYLAFDEDYKVKFVFPDNKQRSNKPPKKKQ